MSWSVGEAGALALKAARGAGMTWGQAEEAGFAVRWLQQRTAPGIEALSQYLANFDPNKIDRRDCPITVGTAISDTAITPPTDLGTIQTPLLLVPFIAAIATTYPIRLVAGPFVVDVFDHDFQLTGSEADILVEHAPCHLVISDSTNFTANNQCAVRVPDATAAAMAQLDKLAQHTYAPSTEESRLSGAGADKDVND